MYIIKGNYRAFTLVELILSIVIISVALTGTIIAVNTVTRHSADPVIAQKALSIGKSYLEEILQKEFPSSVPCGAAPVGGRSVYTNVCNYDGLIDVGAKNHLNQVISGLENYTVSVDIDTLSANFGGLSSGTEIIRIDVNVFHTILNPGIAISAYKANF